MGRFTGPPFVFDSRREADLFSTLREWSDAFNDLENWMHLNALVSLASIWKPTCQPSFLWHYHPIPARQDRSVISIAA